MAIAVVGSINADYVVRVPRFPHPGETLAARSYFVTAGGKGANQACAAARLGATVRFAGQVGNDAQGESLRAALSSDGVDCSTLVVDPTVPTGVALITVDDNGQNEIVVVRGANGTFAPERLAPSALDGAAFVLVQLEIPIETAAAAIERARASGARVILDPSPARPLDRELLSLVDFATPNETELRISTGAERGGEVLTLQQAETLAWRLLDAGVGAVVVKLGAQGALLVDRDRTEHWPAPVVEAVDTTAAGDCFNAAFAVALLEGSDVSAAGRFAVRAASLSVTRPGAQASLPYRHELRDFAAGRDER